jgi:GH35 family endo-1,4-beta-xylanase
MKTHLLSLLALAPLLLAATPAPEGGTRVIPANAIATLRESATSKAGALTRVKVEGQPFAEALRCEIASQAAHPWEAQFQFRTTRRVERGEVLWARFYARTVAAKTETGEGRICAIFEKAGPPHDKSLSRDLDLSREWKEYFFPFKALARYEPGQAGTGFHLGFLEQTVEIADFEVYAFGQGFDLARLPRTQTTYPGQDPAAPWRAAADARIEQHRKADLTVRVKDAAGQPLPGAKVAVAMKRHAFGWGSCVTVKGLLQQDADGDRYRKIIESLYTRVVFENDLKWHSWDNPARHADILKATDWLRSRNIEVRGHCLVWPSWKNTPRDLQALKDNPEALRQRINRHIESEVSALKGRLVDWDVVNEPYNNNDVMKVLGDSEMIAWFKLARQHDPEVNLYLNDYAILSAGGMDKLHQDHFEKTLRFLKEGGAPITGLGMQSHFGGTPTPPEKMLAILDRYAALGLDISITEHDIDTADEQLQADFTRDFLTTVFSHPSVVAVLTWGFWENAHWRPNGAYYRGDWSVKPAGQVWLDLVMKRWWTDVTLDTAADGTARTRGFLGDYEITVTHNGASKTVPAKLAKAGATVDLSL